MSIVILLGCAKHEVKVTKAAAPDKPPASATTSTIGTPGPADAARGRPAGAGGGSLGSPGTTGAPFVVRVVYFDMGTFSVRPQDRAVIQMHANYLVRHPTARIVLQGNADLLGETHISIMRGQRYADAVRNMMVELGVSDDQIEAISFGKENPANPGFDEVAGAANRRVEIQYKGE